MQQPSAVEPPFPLADTGRVIAGLCRLQGRSRQTAEIYTRWIRRLVVFHHLRHPAELTDEDVATFVRDQCCGSTNLAPGTQLQAVQACAFLFRHALQRPLPAQFLRRLRPRNHCRLPSRLEAAQVTALLERLPDPARLIAMLQYGSGLRLSEALRLRIADVDPAGALVTVSGGRPRTVALAQLALDTLREQLRIRKRQHLTSPAQRWFKAPLFVGPRHRHDRNGRPLHPVQLHPRCVQRAYAIACNALGLTVPSCASALVASYAIHQLESGVDAVTLHARLGNRDLRTTLRLQAVSTSGAGGVASPLDQLGPAQT